MATIIRKGPMHNPPHPGAILRDLYMKPLNVSILDAAKALGVTSKHVSGIVNGRARVASSYQVGRCQGVACEWPRRCRPTK
jgi:plasmid maintenance system antidote protein VapI